MSQFLTQRASWKALARHHRKIAKRHLRDLFADDATRGTRLTLEAAWTAVDDILVNHPAALAYKPGTWGPAEAGALIAADGGWQDPVPENGCSDRKKAA